MTVNIITLSRQAIWNRNVSCICSTMLYAEYCLFVLVAGINSITTVSKVSGKAGRSIFIPCLYDSQYRNHVKYLCKGYYWTSCSAVKTNKANSGKFSISDDKNKGIFTVTIRQLTDEDTNYWCAVEINGGPDIRKYFHLSVTRGKNP